MGTWILIIGVLITVVAAGFIFWLLKEDKFLAAIITSLVAALLLGATCSTKAIFDPTIECAKCGTAVEIKEQTK